MTFRLRIQPADSHGLTQHFARLVEIAKHFYPANFDVSAMIRHHIDAGATTILAMLGKEIVGFSMSSQVTRITPFYKRKIPVLYQRLLYIDPARRKQQIGVRLQIAVLRHHLGIFWLFRRFAMICITDNPLVVRAFGLYKTYYPNTRTSTPEEIISFGESLLPIVGGSSLDKNLLVHGTNESGLTGLDYTSWWRKFLESGHHRYDDLLLSTVFTQSDGKIVHNGVSMLAIGYATPLNFVGRFAQVVLQQRRKKARLGGEIVPTN
jgi:hypothetical protein